LGFNDFRGLPDWFSLKFTEGAFENWAGDGRDFGVLYRNLDVTAPVNARAVDSAKSYGQPALRDLGINMRCRDYVIQQHRFIDRP
jgi:hypothetical protein